VNEYPTGTVTFVFTDVVDSSRLWEDHADAMHRAMEVHDQIVVEATESHSGVLVKQTGDGAFAVFASALDAVTAAMSIQEQLADTPWEPASAFEVRIGVHTGEARMRGDDYFGAAVNRAARVMSVAAGGAVVLSLTTQELVRDRLPSGTSLRDLGESDLQGLARPEHIFEMVRVEEGTAHQARAAISPPPSPDQDEAPRAAWIAVMPFEDMSEDRTHGYFADGITEDVITGLAAWSTLRVIARTSSYRYKGSEAGIEQIAAELGVRYVLEGSVRMAGNRVRVTAQLIEAAGRHHVWADRYDADTADIFAVQDAITRGIVVAIDPAIRLAETGRSGRVPTEDLGAWHHFQLGRAEALKYKKEANAAAAEHFTAALEIDPNYSAAWSHLAFVHFVDAWLNFVEDRQASLALAYEQAKKAIHLDESDATAHVSLGFASFGMGRLEAAEAAAERAVQLNPSLVEAHLLGGISRQYADRAEESIAMLDEAIALSPHHPAANFFYGARALSRLLLHHYHEAVADARTAVGMKHGYVFGRIVLASALAHGEDEDRAEGELAELLRVKPDLAPDVLDTYPFRDDRDRRHVIDGLLKAGLAPDA
jgi:TolB-like protein/Tfp pilus assembly protein PilF